jgi:hypothetical protein
MTWYEFSDVRDGQSRRKYDCITVHRPLALKKSQHGKGRLAAGHLHEVSGSLSISVDLFWTASSN